MSFRWGMIPPEHIVLVCPCMVSGCPLCRRAALFCSCASWQPISSCPCRPVALKASYEGGKWLLKQGVKREAACLGSHLRPAEVRESHPGLCQSKPVGLHCSPWSTWLGMCFSGSWGQQQCENYIMHCLFIYLCSLNFCAGGLHPLPHCVTTQIFPLGNSGGSSSVRGIWGWDGVEG